MKFMVLFEDSPNADSSIRTRFMSDHLAFLDKNAGSVEAAGPLVHDDGSGGGGLWIVEAETTAEVQTLVETDPFWPTGLRKSVQILKWRQVFSNGERLIKA